MRFQQVNMVVVVKSLKSCPALATMWTVACQAPLCMGFPSQEYWNGLPFPSPVNLPDPGIKLTSLMSPALAGEIFSTSATLKALRSAWLASVQPFSCISLCSTQTEQLYVKDLLLTVNPSLTEMKI